MEKSLLSYADESFSRRQTLTLWNDKIHLDGKIFLRGEYEVSFPLKGISPNYRTGFFRDNSFSGYVWILIISIVIIGIFYAIPNVDPASFLGGMVIVLPLIGIAGCLATFKKKQSVCFLSSSGQPLFNVIKAGKEKDNFDEVIRRVVDQIYMCNSETTGNAKIRDAIE